MRKNVPKRDLHSKEGVFCCSSPNALRTIWRLLILVCIAAIIIPRLSVGVVTPLATKAVVVVIRCAGARGIKLSALPAGSRRRRTGTGGIISSLRCVAAGCCTAGRQQSDSRPTGVFFFRALKRIAFVDEQLRQRAGVSGKLRSARNPWS